MPIQKKTKIVATLGPATSDKKVLKAMILEGANVFQDQFFPCRLRGSKGTGKNDP